MTALARRACLALALGRRARVDFYRLIADLLEADFALERALDIAARTARDEGHAVRARIVARWRRALLAGGFADAAELWVPAAEAMIFRAYGRIDAALLFAAAARVAELRDRQISALWKAVAMPLVLAAGVVLLLWAAGGHFIPVLETVSPPEGWGPAARLFRASATWLHANPLGFAAGCGAFGAALAAATVAWTGPGRALCDRVAPFSLYRMLTGSAFLFVALEFLRAGIDLNERAFDELRRAASPYARHRIGRIQAHMARGAGLGRSMALAGHGFPDPALIPVIAALDGTRDWEQKLSRFVDRWIARSEAILRTRAAALNGALLIAVTLVMAAGIDAMFSILEQAATRR